MEMFQLIEITASEPFERGRQYGTQAKEKINICVDHYRERFTRSGQSWARVQKYAIQYAAVVDKYMPEALEEAKGIAQGSGRTLEEIMVVNCRYEISKFPKIMECTTAAILPEASAGGKTYLIKNWDYSQEIIPHVVLLSVRMNDGYRAFGVTEAGQMVRDGMNSYGIAFANNNLQSVYDSQNTGLPVTFIRKRLWESSTFKSARAFLTEAERSVSCNTIIAHSSGMALDFETYPGGADTIEPSAGILTHANHFVKNPRIDGIQNRPKNRDTRLYELLNKRNGGINTEYIMECLRDHKYYNLSICAHPDKTGDEYVRQRCTVSSTIMNLTDNVIYVCAGAPCEGGYVRFGL